MPRSLDKIFDELAELCAECLKEGNLTSDIEDFHIRFDNRYDGPPRSLDDELSEFRIKFMQEELDEYIKAVATNDREGMFDALIDLTYVALGTAYLHGFPFDKGWYRVHRANMNKVRAQSASESKRGTQYDVVKPVGWKAPDLMDLVYPPESAPVKHGEK